MISDIFDKFSWYCRHAANSNRNRKGCDVKIEILYIARINVFFKPGRWLVISRFDPYSVV